MKRFLPHYGIATAILSLLVAGFVQPVATARSRYHSPTALALSPDGKTLYVADRTQDAIAVLDTVSGSVTATLALRGPGGLALSSDGRWLYATAAEDDQVTKFDTTTRRPVATAPAGRQPAGLTLSPDNARLYCCNQLSHDVLVYDTASLLRTARLPAVREPRHAALTPDGKLLCLANHLPLGSNLDESLGAELTLVDLAGGGRSQVKLSLGATEAGQVVCTPDGRYAFVGHVLARWLLPPTQLERGWIATSALTVVDLPGRRRLGTVLLDDLDRGAANPWALAISPDGRTLYSTHAGTHEVQIIEVAGLLKLINDWPKDAPTALEDDLTAVYRAGIRQRVACGGRGPRAVLATGDGAFVANYFSGDVTYLSPAGQITRTLSLGPQPPADAARHGEDLFHDAGVCFQGWQSCVTCHSEGRTDGLAWDLLNDGLGNPKNAKSLLLSGQTPPVMAHGVRDTMATAVASGFKFILFHVPTSVEVADTAAYLESLRPARSPLRGRDGSLSASAARGKAVFERRDLGCVTCHPAPLFTDLKSYDVGTRNSFDASGEFDTPTLVELHRTAPYLHDGSAVTLAEVFTKSNTRDRHGRTSQLKESERRDLVEYILSL